MIDCLTPVQERRLAELLSEWEQLGLCTDRCNRKLAEDAMTCMYQVVGKSAPKFIWFDSPLGTTLAPIILRRKERDSLSASLGDSLRDSLWASLRDSLWDSLMDSLWDSLRASLRASLWASLRSHWHWGTHNGGWIAFYSFCSEIGIEYKKQHLDILNYHNQYARNALWCNAYEGLCFISDRPTTVKMERNRNETLQLHNEHGAAFAFADGLAVYAIHGVRVPELVVEKPELITVKMISAEDNAEVRRIMIDRFGRERWLKDSGAQRIHSDDFGTLYLVGQEMAVEVVNSTPESDGTRKKYLMWVDPNGYGGIRTAHAAVAWTWRNPDGSHMFTQPEDYGPTFES